MANLIPGGIIFSTGQDKICQQGDALVATDGNPIQALTGVPGFTGIYGITGIQNPLVGLTGFGFRGQTGIQGETGIDGDVGTTGIQGLVGPAGLTGLSLIGETGIQGTTGPQGTTGIIGNDGSIGLQGVTGVIGLTGVFATGFRGITGVAVQGATGVQGVTGLTGVTGSLGLTGLGLLGETGVQGNTGISGITGINDINSIFNDTQLSGFTMIYPLDANFLGTNSQALEFKTTLTTATDGSPTNIIVQFGGTTVFTDSVEQNGGAFGYLEGIILRQAASTQYICVSIVYSNGRCQVSRAVTSANLAVVQEVIVTVSSSGAGQLINNIIVTKVFQP